MATTNRALSDILAPEFISREAARVNASTTLLSDLFGWGLKARAPRDPGDSSPGANTNFSPIREGFYDIFNMTRRIAHGSVPGTPSTTTAPQPVGKVGYTIPRSAETIPLLDEKLFNQRAIGGPSSMVDTGGERYILRQIGFQAQRYANLVEFQTAAMLRGSYTFTQDGDLLRQTFSGGETTIDFQIPDDNLTDLDMGTGTGIITASWATAGTDIPLAIFNVNAAMIALTGRGIKTIIVSSTVWNHIMNNTDIINQGGSAAPRFNQLDHATEDPGRFVGILKSMPWVEFLINDYGLEIGSANTYTRLIPITSAVFIPDVKPDWVEYLNGGEGVTEGPNGTHEFREGFYQYSYPTHEPSGWALSAVHNGFPSLMVPECIAHGTVVF